MLEIYHSALEPLICKFNYEIIECKYCSFQLMELPVINNILQSHIEKFYCSENNLLSDKHEESVYTMSQMAFSFRELLCTFH